MDRVGQTVAGRIGEHHAAGPAVTAAHDPRQFIQEVVRGRSAAVFSKMVCPSCRKAKEILKNYFPEHEFTVVELDQRPDGAVLQNVLQEMTGKHTVPSVWLNGEFVGGADDLEALEQRGELGKRMVRSG